MNKKQKHQSGQKSEKKYYDRSRKPSFNEKIKNGYVHKCALEHDRKFKKKIAEANKAMKKLFFVSCICFIFMGLEVAGGRPKTSTRCSMSGWARLMAAWRLAPSA